MRRLSISAAAAILTLGGPAIATAQTNAPSEAAASPPAAGETSDRTPQKDTPTPLSQRDKTTAQPVGSSPTPPKQGTTSDRTPGQPGTASDATGGPKSGGTGPKTEAMPHDGMKSSDTN
jgi:hypothetical protein